MFKEDSVWHCVDCGHSSRFKGDVAKHVEAKHIETEGFNCNYCSKFFTSRNSLKSHISRFHRYQNQSLP